MACGQCRISYPGVVGQRHTECQHRRHHHCHSKFNHNNSWLHHNQYRAQCHVKLFCILSSLMWPATFAGRLESWHSLRQQCSLLPVKSALETVNAWWSQTPWQPYYLHWDDQASWPDPWCLLNDNVYCDLARGLGILYTISLLDRADLADAALVLTEDGYNLVLVDKSKYILNWNPDTIVNTNPEIRIKRQMLQGQITQQYN